MNRLNMFMTDRSNSHVSFFSLILSGMDLAVPRHKVAMVTGHALSTVADYLRSEECACRSALDLSSAARMMAVAKTTLSSKAAVCFLSRVELNHLASLLLQVCGEGPVCGQLLGIFVELCGQKRTSLLRCCCTGMNYPAIRIVVSCTRLFREASELLST